MIFSPASRLLLLQWLVVNTAFWSSTLGLSNANGQMICAMVILSAGAALMILRDPLRIALALTTGDTPADVRMMRDPVFYLMGLSVLGLSALICAMFYILGGAARSLGLLALG